ncbi:uncharacterized protein [Patagioenas fasciata]|uniref:uncharacterized protein n=1 Tax=Patagioenas fasciata TaxID=372321 RepID=UPI003A996E72
MTPGWKNVWEVKDNKDMWHEVAESLTCTTGKCPKPQWDERLRFSSSRRIYRQNEELNLTCPGALKPSLPKVKCARQFLRVSSGEPVYGDTWWGRNSTGAWIPIERAPECIEMCQRPQWDTRLELTPDQKNYKKNEEVMLRCPEGLQLSFIKIKCSVTVQHDSNGKPVYREYWYGIGIYGSTSIPSNVECLEMCQRPQWDTNLQLEPDQENYEKNKQVMLSCPEGFQTPFTHVKCTRAFQPTSNGQPVYTDRWLGKDSRDTWIRIQSSVQCIGILQVVPGTLEISSTSIKLNWTCSLPDVCQRMRARCRLAGPSSSPCEAEEVKGEETLQGQEGTFTCPTLQPFTDYSVTISLPPNMILYTQLFRTRETVPDKLEKLWLDPSTGFLRWKPLPSCKGEIIGYQLNITSWRAHDGSFLEFTQVLVNQSVTQYAPPHQAPGSKYMVTVQGLTAAGAGAMSVLEFQSFFSVAGEPLGLWPGMAVTVVVVLSVLVLLSAGILCAVLSRKRKAPPSKAEEDHYTELQPCENLDDYCEIKGTSLLVEGAGKSGPAGKPLHQPLPVLESSGDSRRKEKMGRTSKVQY